VVWGMLISYSTAPCQEQMNQAIQEMQLAVAIIHIDQALTSVRTILHPRQPLKMNILDMYTDEGSDLENYMSSA